MLIFIFFNLGELYTSEKRGNDEKGDGSSENPFKTILNALLYHGKEPFPVIYVDSKSDGQVKVNFLFIMQLSHCCCW